MNYNCSRRNFLNFKLQNMVIMKAFVLECFIENMELPEYWLETIENVSNTNECQKKHCQQNKQCTAFVYNLDAKSCVLKKPPKRFLSIVHLKNSTGNVFGPKYCPGKMIL